MTIINKIPVWANVIMVYNYRHLGTVYNAGFLTSLDLWKTPESIGMWKIKKLK